MLPVAILLPTRNSMKLLPTHLEAMRAWLDLAAEIIIVDSQSADGTCELLRKHLPHATFIENPPGLYQSWNRGIREITSPFTYISTVGDSISREGLLHLHEVAARNRADVTISPPAFIDEAGRPIRGNEWPVHDLIAHLALTQDICCDRMLLFLVALAYIPFAILGSSASNLYRTRALQQWPFPTEYGRNGDGAWGLIHALDMRLALTPRCVSQFRRHRRWYAPEEYDYPDGDRRMLEAAIGGLEARLADDPELRREMRDLKAQDLIDAKRTVQRWRDKLHASRKRLLPWIFDPLAWRARVNRDAAQGRCVALLRELLRTLPPTETSRVPRAPVAV